jgi:hypothetical protein
MTVRIPLTADETTRALICFACGKINLSPERAEMAETLMFFGPNKSEDGTVDLKGARVEIEVSE